MSNVFHIIGITDSRQQFFSPDVQAVIATGRVFSGGKRHREIMQDYLPEGYVWIDVTVPLAKVFLSYEAYDDIVIFASGDPLFYGIANTLQREFPGAKFEVYPALNSLQMLAHKFTLAYADMINVSVTGRPWKMLDVALIENRRLIGVLTDKQKGPAEIASRLLEFGYDNYIIHVGESLGNETGEKVQTLLLKDAVETKFSHPNCVILQMVAPRQRYFGLPEDLFEHLDGRVNMITKMPIRLLTLSMLELSEKRSLWDVGFCTGSVSIEAKLRFPQLEITAFERREESRRLLAENTKKFGTPGITGVIADFMDCDLSSYPRPDAVFIGGHGGRLDDMVKRISDVLLPDGVIVFNSVSDESCAAFENAIAAHGRTITERHTIKLDNHNPITIIKAK